MIIGNTNKTNIRYFQLDGLRGVAALMIVFHHMPWFSSIVEGLSYGLVDHKIYRSLASGVDLFFVLSGFLITQILLRSRERDNYYTKFYARRAFRIFPLYYGMIAAFAIACLIPSLIPSVMRKTFYDSWLWLVFYAGNIHAMMYGLGAMTFTHFWSLAVEEHFYLFWPYVIKNSRLYVGRIIVVFIILGILTRLLIWIFLRSESANWNYVFTLSRLDALAIGGLIAYFVERDMFSRLKINVVFYCSVAMVVMMVVIQGKIWGNGTFFMDVFGYTIYALGYGGIIVGLVFSCNNHLVRILSSRILVYFGAISYSLYVLHYPINARFLSLASSYGNDYLKTVMLTGFVLLCVVIAATLSYYVYERPFLILKDKWFSK